MQEIEGVIKYQLDYRHGAAAKHCEYRDLMNWHRKCRVLDVLGQDPQRYEGYAFGNISVRCDAGFVISGTQSAGKPALAQDDYAYVQVCEPQRNYVQAVGPVKPSSEALTHGEIYAVAPAIQAIIHAHTPLIWGQAEALGLPVTPKEVAYGTPQMAAAVRAIVEDLGDTGLLVMGGHEDGVIAYGSDLDAAGACLESVMQRAAA